MTFVSHVTDIRLTQIVSDRFHKNNKIVRASQATFPQAIFQIDLEGDIKAKILVAKDLQVKVLGIKDIRAFKVLKADRPTGKVSESILTNFHKMNLTRILFQI